MWGKYRFVWLYKGYACLTYNFDAYSWGTKGDNSVAKDLGVVKVSEKEKGVKTVEIELPADQHDINCQYDEALFALDEKSSKDTVSTHQWL